MWEIIGISKYTGYLFFFVLFLIPTSAYAKRYFTWVDAQGHIRETLIPDNPVTPIRKIPIKKSSKFSTKNSKDQVKKTNNTEKKGSVSIYKESPDAIKASTLSPEKGGYIDAEQLERQGFLRDPKHPPTFVWRDSRGLLHDSPYYPTPDTPVEHSPFYDENGYTLGTETLSKADDPISAARRKKMDSFARKLFLGSSGQPAPATIFNSCCAGVPKNIIKKLTKNSELAININTKSNSYHFTDGISRFSLIRLPIIKKNYALKLSLIVRNKSRSHEGEVFFPRLVFLDRNFKAIRMVNDPVMEFVPESWSSQASLKGIFRVDIKRGERYLLLYSSRKDLLKKSIIVGKASTERIWHSTLGMLELYVQ